MKIIDIPGGQRSEAWHQHRRDHFNASDAPAMMGVSPHETRTALLTRISSGVDREPTAIEKDLFADGHRSEALARPLAEAAIDDDLYPLVMANGKLSASLDGHTLDLEGSGAIDWEHKRLNARLREALPLQGIGGPEVGRALPIDYQVQVAHQQHCSGAAKTLFTASQWDADGKLIEARHCWIERDETLIAAVVAGWAQFEKDLQGFVPTPAAPAVVATPMEHLPAVSIQTSGSLVVKTNLDIFGERLRAFVAKLPKEPETDQEFADLGAACKRLKLAEEAIDSAVNSALASVGDVERMRTLALELRDMARTNRLASEKVVNKRKDEIKVREVRQRHEAIAAYVGEANKRLGGPYIDTAPDFAGVIRGLSSLDSLRDKLNTALANAKIAVDAAEARVAMNLKAIEAAGADLRHLFADRAALVLKDPEAVAAIVGQRVAEHKAVEQRRLDAERERIRAEEESRARQLAAQQAAPPPAPPAPPALPVQAPTPSAEAPAAPVNAEGPISAAPQPAPGLAFDARGVLAPVAAPAMPATETAAADVPCLSLGEVNARFGDGTENLGMSRAYIERVLGEPPTGFSERKTPLYSERALARIALAIYKRAAAVAGIRQ